VAGVLAASDKLFDFEIINLGNSDPISLDGFIKVIEEVVGNKATRVGKPRQPGDVMRTCADVSKGKRLIGYSPRTGLREGLEAMYSWYVSEADPR